MKHPHTVQLLRERISWNLVEATTQWCYMQLLLCRGSSGLVVGASDWVLGLKNSLSQMQGHTTQGCC